MVERCHIIESARIIECENGTSEETFDCCDILILTFLKVCAFILKKITKVIETATWNILQ